MPHVKHVCDYCNIGFERYERPSQPKYKRKFCSQECSRKWHTESKEHRNPKTFQVVTCVNCGKERTLNRNDSDDAVNRYCDKDCMFEWLRLNGQPLLQKRVYFNCEICGVEFSKPKSHANRSKLHFCSDTCHGKHRSTLTGTKSQLFTQVQINCDHCGDIFYRKPSQVNRNEYNFCSKDCHTEHQNTPEMKEFYREQMVETLSTYPRRTTPEKMVLDYLTEINVPFSEQEIINDRFCVDFLIRPNNHKGIIIEVLGDYFHCNPQIYETPINDMQIKNLANDKRKFNYLKKCGYSVYGIWEKDLHDNIGKAMASVVNHITQLIAL